MIKYIIFLCSFLFLLVPLDLSVAPSLNYGLYGFLSYVFYIIFWIVPIVYLYKKQRLTWGLFIGVLLVNILGFAVIEYLAQEYGVRQKTETLERAKYYQEMRNKEK